MQSFFNRAQAGLEYLMTYGWALVLIITVLAVLFFLFSPTASNAVFSSSNPTKILIRTGNISGTTAEIQLQNATGGKIQLNSISSEKGYRCCNIVDGSLPSQVNGGGIIKIQCTATPQTAGAITLNYIDYFSQQKSVKISGSGKETEQTTGFLVGYWKANNNATDSSGNANNGTWFGTTAYAGGTEGQAFNFPGNSTTGISVTDNSSFDMPNGVTMAAWVYRRSFSAHNKVMIKPFDLFNSEPWELYSMDYKCNSPGCPCMLISDGIQGNPAIHQTGACADTVTAPLNEWHHIAGTYDGCYLKIFSDGALVGSEISNLPLGTNNEAFYINGFLNSSFHIDGLTDEAKLYNYALTDSEICAVCNEFKPAGGNCNC